MENSFSVHLRPGLGPCGFPTGSLTRSLCGLRNPQKPPGLGQGELLRGWFPPGLARRRRRGRPGRQPALAPRRACMEGPPPRAWAPPWPGARAGTPGRRPRRPSCQPPSCLGGFQGSIKKTLSVPATEVPGPLPAGEALLGAPQLGPVPDPWVPRPGPP